ncbi:hypothetical protein TWF569_004317 [Orbilia oligospora]|uniref:Uncharacterized protein n=1 Tax=Orbilia oligospora TaxID=2813651 RepID=A0A7C8JFY4_ORBOL|nr:hypothetical protein TWF103_005128 [Orbilia oligospora]KAF3098743.1 hypothetical protein TWF706_006748 [Orbilia oligospora]KAF3099453.1 hypothetical protein TWF102_005433 [Orbilia oligospora]KAF3119116.1 hypothetical protein TWF569_004317 [Orbilia oligospora]KAF3130003.1 hypothetical protein TWF594_010577 [Orbilia oligospora]
MQLKFFVAAFASLALASAVALPEPQDASPPFVCGCTNACKLANKPGILCPEYCDPKYECPPTPVSYAPTTTQTPIRITETCGPCLNDCLVGCPDLRLCRCADFCDPKYFCPTSTTTTPTRPTLTPRPTFVCGCTNACKIACPTCICPQYCDPKYECDVAAALSIKTTKTTAAPPKPTCGCTNDCIVNCPPGENCICPQYCDPKYICPTTKPTKTTTSVKPTFTCGCLNDCIVNCKEEPCGCPRNCDPKYACPETLLTKKSIAPIPTTTGIPCGCHNDCTISCNKRGCACPAYCDPKYACNA